MGACVLALDLGTGSTRAVLFDAGGRQLAAASREWFHHPEPGVSGSQVFDTSNNWTLICECIREALRAAQVAAEDVIGVSATSMREGVVLFDENGSEIWACPNVDGRAGAQASRLIDSGLARQIYDQAGDWVSITSPARLLWLRDNSPEILRRVRHLGMLSDWALYRLSGHLVTDPSAGSSSGMFNLAERQWSEDIPGWGGIDVEVLPEVVDSGTVIGAVTRLAAQQTGLSEGTPVVVGGADTQMALAGMGGDAHRLTVIGGSFWQTTWTADRPVIDSEARLRTLCHSVPNQWMIEGVGFYCGIAMRWYRDGFCHREKSEAATKNIDPYSIMEEAAAHVSAGSDGVIAIFGNTMDAKHWVQASPGFMQFSIDSPGPTGTAHCIRALEEAATYVTRSHVEIIEQVVGRNVPTVTFTGGGARGRLWSQILADVLGRPVEVPTVKESSALGAAIYAGIGAGLFPDISVASDFRQIERTFEPDTTTHTQYDSYYDHWQKVYSAILGLTERGLLRPMWWPPGAAPPAKEPVSRTAT